MKNCLKCDKELTGRQRRFCSPYCRGKYNFDSYGGHEYTKKLRSANARSYLSRLRSINSRKDTLSLDYLVNIYEKQSGLCAISGIEMTYDQPGGNAKVPTNMSIDKINPNLGYVEGNIQLLCHRANIMKFDGTEQDLFDWCTTILAGSRHKNRSYKRTKDAHKVDPKS